MGNGYLGKISAIVTANTGDFKPKLDAAASDVSKFARSVQSNLTSASSQAGRAFDGIWTRLQRMENSLNAAGSLKLSFKGFDGAVKTVEALNARLAELGKRQIDISVAGTGFENVNKLREAIRRLKSEDIDFVRGLGGLSEARALRPIMKKKERAQLDKFDGLQDLGQIDTAMEVLGGRFFEEAANRMRGLTSAAEELGKPLSSAVQKFETLGLTVQGSFKDAMVRAATEVQHFKDAFDKDPGAATDKWLDDLRKRVELTTAAVDRLAEAQSLAKSGMTGKELAFGNPSAADALKRSSGISQMASSAPAEVRLQLAPTITEMGALREKIVSVLASVESGAALNIDVSGAIAELDSVIAKSESAASSVEAAINSSAEARSKATAVGQAYLGVLQSESQQLSLSGKVTYAEVVAGIEQANAAKEKATAVGQAYLGVLQSESQQLSLSGRNTYAEVLEDIEANMRKVKAAADFGGTVSQAFDAAKLGGYKAQLTILKDILVKYGIEGGEAAERVDELAAALQRVYAAGAQSAPSAIAAISAQADAAVEAVGAATPLGAKGVKGAFDRAGDVGRFGADKFSLGLQQAAFAIDDFFSVTGGFEQRIRAMGNNLTQIGFIVGGTKGLFAALGVTVGAQAAVMLYKFYNSGRSTDDMAKALNETLAKQKSLIADLAATFSSLGEEIASAGFSKSAADADKMAKAIFELRKTHAAALNESFAAVDPEMLRIRGTIVARQNELAKTSNPGRAVALQVEIDQLAEQQRLRMNDYANRPNVSAGGAAKAIAESMAAINEGYIRDIQRSQASDPYTEGTFDDAKMREEGRAKAKATADALLKDAESAPDDVARQREIIKALTAQRDAAAELSKKGTSVFGTSNAAREANNQLVILEGLLRQARAGLDTALNELVISLTKDAYKTAEAIGQRQQALESAVGPEVAQTLRVFSELNIYAGQLRDAQKRAADARARGDEGGVREAMQEVSEIENATEAFRSVEASVTAFAAALDRVAMDLANTVAGEAKSAAEQARRDENAARGFTRNVQDQPNENGARRGGGWAPAAIEEFESQERRRRRVEADREVADEMRANVERQRNDSIAKFERDARKGDLGDLTKGMIDQRDAAQAEIDAAVAAGQRVSADAVRRRDEAQRGLDTAFENSAVGAGFDKAADAMDIEMASRRERENDISRGRDVGQTQAEKAGRSLADDIRGLEAAARDRLGAAVGNDAENKIQQDLAADRRRVIEDSMRQQAPAIFNLADSVQNAVMQGPSRAALQANDVTTTQGAAELNRLLRGDDSARNQDLVELQKQSQALDELVRIARENGTPAGVFDF